MTSQSNRYKNMKMLCVVHHTRNIIVCLTDLPLCCHTRISLFVTTEQKKTAAWLTPAPLAPRLIVHSVL